MSEYVKGKVTDIFKSNQKDDEKFGRSAQLKITIDGGAEYNLFYNYGKAPNFKGEPMVIGDEIEFNWERNENYGTKDILNKKDNYTLKNLSNPDSIPEKKPFTNNGYKADPGKDARMVRGAAVRDAVEVLKHNLTGSKITFEAIKKVAMQIEEFVYEAKPKSSPEEVKPSTPIATEPQPSNAFVEDEIIPF